MLSVSKHHSMEGSKKEELNIVLLGKTGDGKSSSGNTILNEKAFTAKLSPNSTTQKCESKSGTIHGRPAAVVDTPGFFDTDLPDDELRSRIVEFLIQCAPGVHAFLIVLKVGTYTDQEKEVVKKITETCGDDALKYSVVLFTHADQLNDGQTIEDFVRKSEELQELVDKCRGRCHFIDNKYWNQQQDEFRNNSVQTKKLLDTVVDILRENSGKCYTNELLQKIMEDIQAEEKRIRKDVTGKVSQDKISEEAKKSVFKKYLKLFAGVATGALLGAVFGAVALGPIGLATSGLAVLGIPATKAAVGAAAVIGAAVGYEVQENTESVSEAIKAVVQESFGIAKDIVHKSSELASAYTKLKGCDT